jgi:PHD/YefM family antitoxin component YafN of YafNO toxin-antitoxin module
MVTITAAAFQKAVGRYREIAQREAVSITNHGRESLVLLSSQEYHRLKALDTREAIPASALTDRELAALDEARTPPEAARFNHELTR